jgi:prepilin-type N-terminal cleavage/methylation domain-containing protein
MFLSIKRSRGVSLIELLVALVICAVIMGGIYRTFIRQQKTYVVQEQVVDMQQNARLAIGQIMRDIRSAGFGNVSMAMTATSGPHGLTHVFNPNIPDPGSLTIVLATQESTTLEDILSPRKIKVNDNTPFSSGYFSIGGVETHATDGSPPVQDTDRRWIVTLKQGENIMNFHPTPPDHPAITPVYGIRTVTYRHDPGDPLDPLDDTIKRSESGKGEEVLADNIESLQFRYYTSSTDETGTDSPTSPGAIERIRVTVTARTGVADPEFGGSGGFRRRQITSYIKVRNPLTP